MQSKDGLHFKYKKYFIKSNEISFCQISMVHTFIKWKIYFVGYSSLWVVPAIIYLVFAGTTAKLLGLDQLHSQNCIQRYILQWQNDVTNLYHGNKISWDFSYQVIIQIANFFVCVFFVMENNWVMCDVNAIGFVHLCALVIYKNELQKNVNSK